MACTIACVVILLVAVSCSNEPEISSLELEQIVRGESVPFDTQAIPDEIIDNLASYRIVVVGETHHLLEHRELLVEMLRKLHEHGFRQMLFEWTQVADWLLDDFVLDGGLEPGWAPPPDIGGDMIAAIRDFNRTLPEEDRIRIRPIDITLQDYGGAESFLASLGALSSHLTDPGPLTDFLQGNYDTPETQESRLKDLQVKLNNDQSDLVESWGKLWYDRVVEMVEVELTSVHVRAIRESNYDESVRVREDAIKQLVDSRLRDFPHGTLINIGATHAQKERLWGTKIEWLGDYLVHKSEVANGSVLVLAVLPAYIVSVPGSGIPDFDLSASPGNELLQVMSQTWPGENVFLSLKDPKFSGSRVPINSEGSTYKGVLKRYFDAFILLPKAHRVSVGY